MNGDILAVDVGTTALKAAVFGPDLVQKAEASASYAINLYDQGKADIEPDKWWSALKSCCTDLQFKLKDVGTISFSVTTPGLVPMLEDGTSLGPAILFCDGRSTQQSREIRRLIGEEVFLQSACNLPVSGGSSLSSILWIRDNQPDVFKAVKKFGHTNTYMVKRFTDTWAIDPSTVSITGLYNTRANDLTWLDPVFAKSSISKEKLPPLVYSHRKVADILPAIADELGLPRSCAVLCGGNDAVLAGYSAGLREPGDIVDIAGTCEIISVCLDRPIGSRNHNIRCHVLAGKWVTLYVLNTGGKALEWFHNVFCRDMSASTFYRDFVPDVIHRYMHNRIGGDLAGYTPFLQGSRYSLEKHFAGFSKLTLETTREKMLLGLLKGNLQYLGLHLQEMGKHVPLSRKIITTGGGAKIEGMNLLKCRWLGEFGYEYREQSSLLGAAMLGELYLKR